jgi:hypothetical protein
VAAIANVVHKKNAKDHVNFWDQKLTEWRQKIYVIEKAVVDKDAVSAHKLIRQLTNIKEGMPILKSIIEGEFSISQIRKKYKKRQELTSKIYCSKKTSCCNHQKLGRKSLIYSLLTMLVRL